jgi:hypothetical protein
VPAEFHDGVLEATVPKPEQRKPRRIEVEGDGEPKTIQGTSTAS